MHAAVSRSTVPERAETTRPVVYTTLYDLIAAVNEAIGSETAGEADDGHEEIGERADFPHARERKLAVMNEIVGQPGQQKI